MLVLFRYAVVRALDVVVHHERNTFSVFQRIPWPWRLHHACAPTDLKRKAKRIGSERVCNIMAHTCGGMSVMIGRYIGSFLVPQSQVCPSPTKNPILIMASFGTIAQKQLYVGPNILYILETSFVLMPPGQGTYLPLP